MMQDSALLEVFLAQRRIRVEVPLQGFERVSDLLNSRAQELISGSMLLGAADLPGGSTQAGGEAREILIRVADARLVCPIVEPSHPESRRRERIRQRVVLEIDEWQVTGDVHLLDRVPWIDFLTAYRNRFLPITSTSVRFGVQPTTVQYDALLVNGARLSALYEVS
ncbi:MAG: hypothetical protein QOF51_947 [Chloroflexota bacterium]|nr:hypothetical protein [Chloroflexota bacterium]